MASNIERLGGYIKDKTLGTAKDFAFGAKAAFYSGNPAVFSNIESGINKLKDSFRKNQEEESKSSRREQAEQRRQRGFQEEQAREQRYNELQQQKIFESMDENIKKILELLGKDGAGRGIGFNPAGLLAGAAGAGAGGAGLASRAAKALQSVPRPTWLDDLKSGRVFPRNLPERFPRSMLPRGRGLPRLAAPDSPRLTSRLTAGLGRGFSAVKDDSLKFLANFMKQLDKIFDSIRPALNSIKEFFGPELKMLKALGPKILKALPGVGLFIMAIEGIINAFDTSNLQKIFGEQKVGFSERVGAFVGGFLGAFAGLIDLVLMAFGIEIETSVQSQSTEFLTKVFGNIFRFFQDMFASVGATLEVAYGALTGDKERLETGMNKLTDINIKYMGYLKNFFYDIGEFFELSMVTFEGVKREIGYAIEDGAAIMMNKVVSFLGGMVNFVIRAFNDFVIDIVDTIPDRPFGVDISDKKKALKETLTFSEKDIVTFQAKTSQVERDSSYESDNALREQIKSKYASLRAAIPTTTAVSTPENVAAATGNLDPNIPPDDKLSTKGDTEEQTEEIVQALEGSSEACLEGDEKLIDSGKVLSEAEQAAADSRHEESMAMAQANYRLQEAFNAQINGWMSQQSDLVQALLDPLLKGGSGGGPLGTIFKNIFGESGIGDALGNLLGKGKGGLFDSISGFFKSNLGGLSTLGDALGDLLKGSSGTNIFSTPGFGGGTAGMDPLAALLGTKLSGSLGLTGVGANAAFDVAKSLLTPGTGMAGIKGALQGPGGFAGGLGAIMSVFNGNVDTPGGALSAGLGVYQLLRGGGVGGVLGGGIGRLGAELFTRNMTDMGLASNFMGRLGGGMMNFGAGMSAGASTGFNLGGQGFGGMGQTGFAANAGAALGAIGNGMMTYAIANMLSGGYEINKSLNKVAGAVGAFFGPVGAAITGVVMGGLNRLFGRKAKEYTDVGLDLNLGTDTTGQVYKDWIKKGGVYRSDKKGTEYDDLDNELVQYFNSSAKAIQQGYGSLAEMMGLSADSIVGFAQSYSISLKGLSAAEQQKKIAEAMEQYARDAIRSSYGDVSRFSKQGEDTLQTFERMATAAQSVNYWFDALGYTAEQTVDMFSKMVDAQGLLTASSTGFFNVDWMNSPYYKQMMEEFGGGDYAGGGRGAYSQYFTDGMANMFGGGIPIAYLQNMYGQGQQGTFEPTEEQKKLAIAGAQANFVEMFGGEENFGRVMQSYFSGFYTPEEQAEFMARQATIQAQQQLELVQTQLDALSEQFEGIDPDLAQRLEGITSREQIEEAKAEYRKAIEAAMEAGDMALAAELLQSADIFTQAAEMQLQAAEMNGEAASSAQDYAIGQIESGYSGVYVSTNQASGNLGTSAALIQDDMSSEPSAQVNAITPIVMGGNTVNNSSAQISSMGGGSGSSVRDYHPILSIDVRGTTAGYLGLGSR